MIDNIDWLHLIDFYPIAGGKLCLCRAEETCERCLLSAKHLKEEQDAWEIRHAVRLAIYAYRRKQDES